ncbi:ArsR/SmtB family transcription factor [Lutispora sp.]|uniref:ArsR/SmtB family transcription factor n=1 Tax=Lutispora sp. TaxID=2828727 RepID=UPI000EE73833|nr:metalloregulator ArsR/SmtB family transcription factor [Lutispora sp.]MEA4964111.1 metalloregulator ArsR/SmtB family transcription factor [Lutispora sp.]HCJ57346.1 ArsR family transcriptional regulator [Clostridiaceae bacterium]
MDFILQLFKALGDETRLKILIILSRKRICAKGVARHLNLSEAAVSQHLKILRDAGLIEGRKSGYFVHYDVQKQVLSQIIEFINQLRDDNSSIAFNHDLNIPDDCEVLCSSRKARCCKNHKR